MKSITNYIEESKHSFRIKSHLKGMNKQEALDLIMSDNSLFVKHKTFDNDEFLSYETEDDYGRPFDDESDCYFHWQGNAVLNRATLQELERELSDKKYDTGWSLYTP